MNPRAVFHLHLPLLPFLFSVEFPGFPKPVLCSHSPFLPCQGEGWLYTVLPWKHLLGTGWRWVRAGNAREAEKTKCRSPTRFLSSAGLPVFAGLFAKFRTLCQKQRVSSNGERTNVIPGDFLASSKVTAWFFHGNLLPVLDPFPFPFPRAPVPGAARAGLTPCGWSWQGGMCSHSPGGSLPPTQHWEVFLGGELT